MYYAVTGCKSHRVSTPATHHLSWPKIWKCSGVAHASSILWRFWQQPCAYQVSWLWYVVLPCNYNCVARYERHFRSSHLPHNFCFFVSGISRLTLPSGTKGFGGTEGFMAPEIMRYNGEEEYTEKVKINFCKVFLYFDAIVCIAIGNRIICRKVNISL